ncbi:MAG TPA: hypothetical protein PK095_00505 [Myxococcota bacterium]|nr:hypothetical protein [Myxococcota bacterium]
MFLPAIPDSFHKPDAIMTLLKEASDFKANLAKAVSVIGTPPDKDNNEAALFVPEQVHGMWLAETVRNTDIKMFHKIPEVPWGSTLYKYIVTSGYGGAYHVASFSENDLPADNGSKSHEGEYQLKLTGEVRRIGRLNETVYSIGGINPGGPVVVSRSGRARQTANAIRSQVIKAEELTFWGDSAVNPLEYDGLIPQMRAKGVPEVNKFDLRKAPLTWARIFMGISLAEGKPFSANIDEIVMSSRQWASLAIETTDSGRWTRTGNDGDLTADGWRFNPARMYLISPKGNRIHIVINIFLDRPSALPSVAEGAATPVLTYADDVTSLTAAGTGSKFLTGQTVKYAIKAVFKNGTPVHFVTPNVEIESGETVTCVMDDASLATSESGALVEYDIWRTDDGGDLTTLKPLKRVRARNVSGHTEWTDDNSIIPGTDTVLAVQYSEHAIVKPTLLKMSRFPVQVPMFGTAMLVARADGVCITQPGRQVLWENCGHNPLS